jgi:hypothetical protein
MYADDLALIANSSTDLQAMLEIVFLYSVQWCYQLNIPKSAILIFGESAAALVPEIAHLVSGSYSKVIPEKSLTTTLEFFNLSPHPLTLVPQSAAVPQ